MLIASLVLAAMANFYGWPPVDDLRLFPPEKTCLEMTKVVGKEIEYAVAMRDLTPLPWERSRWTKEIARLKQTQDIWYFVYFMHGDSRIRISLLYNGWQFRGEELTRWRLSVLREWMGPANYYGGVIAPKE